MALSITFLLSCHQPVSVPFLMIILGSYPSDLITIYVGFLLMQQRFAPVSSYTNNKYHSFESANFCMLILVSPNKSYSNMDGLMAPYEQLIFLLEKHLHEYFLPFFSSAYFGIQHNLLNNISLNFFSWNFFHVFSINIQLSKQKNHNIVIRVKTL